MNSSLYLLVSLILISVVILTTSESKRPHIVFYLIDDLGWDDVGYRSPTMYSPVLDSLKESGITMERYYTQPLCSPSRSALMTGRYPFRMGMQHLIRVVQPGSPAALPVEQPTIAEVLQSVGYSTAAVGKWHLGCARESNLPNSRGFDYFKGFYLGDGDYYTKMKSGEYTYPNGTTVTFTGFDWWENGQAIWTDKGIHDKVLYDQAFDKYMAGYTPSEDNPLFFYFSQQLVHLPLEVDSQWYEHCQDVKDSRRRTYCAMMAASDDSLNNVVQTLKEKGMWDDTILIVSTDNGGSPWWENKPPASAGSNYPLRSGKGTLFEGGVRGVGFVNGGNNVIPEHSRGKSIEDWFHIVDWFPTLLKRAQVPKENKYFKNNIDGLDIWDILTASSDEVIPPLPRQSIPLNLNLNTINYTTGSFNAIISKGWKLIQLDLAINNPPEYDGWYPELPNNPIPAPYNPTPGLFLFNLNEDPNEEINLYSTHPNKVAELNLMIEHYLLDYKPPMYNEPQLEGMPMFHNGTWSPFLPAISIE